MNNFTTRTNEKKQLQHRKHINLSRPYKTRVHTKSLPIFFVNKPNNYNYS